MWGKQATLSETIVNILTQHYNHNETKQPHDFLNLTKMTRNTILKLSRPATRQITPRTTLPIRAIAPKRTSFSIPMLNRSMQSQTQRCFSSTRPILKGLSPESENPAPAQSPPKEAAPTAAANLTPEHYNVLSDMYLNALVAKLEELQEENEKIDVDYSVCAFPPCIFPSAIGLEMANKQAQNRPES
jgi:frataxin